MRHPVPVSNLGLLRGLNGMPRYSGRNNDGDMRRDPNASDVRQEQKDNIMRELSLPKSKREQARALDNTCTGPLEKLGLGKSYITRACVRIFGRRFEPY